jgi:hypothetical protein
MEVLHQRCAGLDVHKETVVGCLRVPDHDEVRYEVRRFATTTAELLELADWLRKRVASTWRWKLLGFTGSWGGTSWRGTSS